MVQLHEYGSFRTKEVMVLPHERVSINMDQGDFGPTSRNGSLSLDQGGFGSTS